jgi:molybdopterin-guanine dinucleotide biosynthesis protein A
MQAARCAVIVLAGGKSTRLGRDKASEVLAGKTLLQRAMDACEAVASRFVIVKARDQRLPEVASDAPIGIVEDVYRETGPLGGIYTGLNALAADPDAATLVVACDMPLLQPALLQDLIRRIPGHVAVAPVRDGLPEPLCAVYTTKCLEPARKLLDRGAYKLSGLLDEVDTLNVPEEEWRRVDPNGLSFLNVNREEDLEQLRRLIEG